MADPNHVMSRVSTTTVIRINQTHYKIRVPLILIAGGDIAMVFLMVQKLSFSLPQLQNAITFLFFGIVSSYFQVDFVSF